MPNSQKILVTGCTGFIGSHLCEKLLARNECVWGIDNLSRKGASLNLAHLRKKRSDLFQFTELDITNRENLDSYFKENGPFDLIAHEAGQVAVTTSLLDPVSDFATNAAGTLHLLECIRLQSSQAKLIFASTNKVYGNLESLSIEEADTRYILSDLPDGVSETHPLEFHSPYGCSKGAADQYVCDYARSFGLRTTVLRQSCIYGTRQFGLEDQGWVAWFLIATAMRRPITLFGDGKQVRDLLWIDDLCDLYLKIWEMQDFPWGTPLNVGGGKNNTLSLVELFSLMKDMGLPAPTCSSSTWRKGDQRIFIANNTKTESITGWKPKTSLKIGLQRLWNWINENKALISAVLYA